MNKYINKRIFDSSWDFLTANTKEYTHVYHIYPAMMIPQIARRLLKQYANGKTRILFDPYCGTGTSLVESNLLGISNMGTDLNPLARLISKVKNVKYPENILEKAIEHFEAKFFIAGINGVNGIETPEFPNINFWFNEEIKKNLSFIQREIEELPEDIKEFFLIPFSETIREGSYTRNSEFKLFRIPKEKMKDYNPDVFKAFIQKSKRNIVGLREFNKSIESPKTEVYDFNTCNGIPKEHFPDGIDIIVTSPPYGDSRTTVAYGQFSRLTNQWLGFKEAAQVDNLLMGGKVYTNNKSFDIETCYDDLKEIHNADPKRYKEVMSFLFDYKDSIDNISELVNKNGIVCYVVGNRRVKNVQIQLDAITAELFEKRGFTHLSTIVRSIPNKRMPSKNSPTNVTGALSETMTNEFIVIMQKN